jgi:transcriptional regulator with PAS, ATPase and Fis domain
MPLSIQGKLLRVLQEKEVRRVGSNENIPIDARVLAATNTSLEQMIKEGTFREDLYYRISVIPIDIPPLRDRPEDIMPLVYHVMKRETMEGQTLPLIEPEVVAILESYTWPGNVREVENTVTHAITFAREGKITKADLPAKVAATPLRSGSTALADDGDRGKSLKAFLRAKEKEYLEHVLSLSGGNKEDAAKTLKISLATLYRKLPENES